MSDVDQSNSPPPLLDVLPEGLLDAQLLPVDAALPEGFVLGIVLERFQGKRHELLGDVQQPEDLGDLLFGPGGKVLVQYDVMEELLVFHVAEEGAAVEERAAHHVAEEGRQQPAHVLTAVLTDPLVVRQGELLLALPPTERSAVEPGVRDRLDNLLQGHQRRFWVSRVEDQLEAGEQIHEDFHLGGVLRRELEHDAVDVAVRFHFALKSHPALQKPPVLRGGDLVHGEHFVGAHDAPSLGQ